VRLVEAHVSGLLRILARFGAFLIVLLLAAVWTFAALDSFARPLFDIGRPAVGDVIIWAAGVLSLSPQSTLLFALTLVGLKLMVGAFLLATLICAAYEKLRWKTSDDAMLDVALFIAAVASAASALPGLTHGGEMLNQIIGELMLCVIASALAIYGRGYLVKQELPPPTRVEPAVITTR
jgi:undecaprenyl pyrophosphate phosphatase UppP